MLKCLTSLLLFIIIALIIGSYITLFQMIKQGDEFKKIAKFKPGMVVEHKLTGEKMLIISYSWLYEGNYLVRTSKNNERIAIYEIEIAEK